MARLHLTLLGRFEARLEPGPVLRMPTRKIEGLLAYLALPLGRAHPRDQLTALFWGELREAQARTNLRQALHTLRKALGPTDAPALLLNGSTLALDPTTVAVDVATFEQGVRASTLEALIQVAAVYQGDLLEGLTIREPPFEDWLMAQRERLRELALEALAKLLTHQRAVGATENAVATALRLVALDPLLEPVHRTLMRLYVQLGRREAALRQYRHCVGTLGRELGVEPERETMELYNEILRQRASRASTPSGVTVARADPPWDRPMTAEAWRTAIPLVGRKPEMARLHAALSAVCAGHGQVLAILGECGVGKSRLVGEFGTEVARQGWRVLVGHAHRTEQCLPLAIWVDAFRTGRVTRDLSAVSGLGLVWRAALTRLLPELGEAIVQSDAGVIEPLTLFESMGLLLGRLAVQEPLLLILEDLQWADELSLRFLAFLGHRLRRWPILAVATVRVEALGEAPVLRQILEDLDRSQPCLRLTLSPLSRTDTWALMRPLVSAERKALLGARLGEQVWLASEGNPFIVVELVRALQERRVTQTCTRLPLPPKVKEVIGSWLGQLGVESQQLLAVAAVIGGVFEFGLLQVAAGLGETETADRVEDLVRRRVLQVVGDRFAFVHGWIREAAYSQLLPPRRTLLQHAVAAARATLSSASRVPSI